MEAIDVIYPLSNKSAWNDNELKYSIRSLVDHVNINNIIVVGHKPQWMSDEVIHIPLMDPSQRQKGSNIIHKTKVGCTYATTKNFLRLSDDHIIIKNPEFNPYNRGLLVSSCTLEDNIFIRSCAHTYNYLNHMGLPKYNYEGHYPVIMDRRKFIDVVDQADLFDGIGYVINSLYFNHVGEFPKEPDNHVCRARDRSCPDGIDNYRFLNYNDFSLSLGLKQYIMKKFPNPTKYER